jgi:hypothetical protein
VVGTHEVGLAGLAEAGTLGHHLRDAIERQLEREHADEPAAVVDGRGGEAGRCVVGGGIGGEVLDREAIARLPLGRAEDLREGGVRPGAAREARREVELLVHAVDDVARRGIDEEHVVVAELLHELAHRGMQPAMRFIVGAAVAARVEQVLRAERVAVRCNPRGLQSERVRVEAGEHGAHVGPALAGVVLRVTGEELVAVVVGQPAGRARPIQSRLACVGPEGGTQVAHAGDDGGVRCERDGLVAHRVEVALDGFLLHRADGRQLVVGALLEGRTRGHCGDHADDQERDEGHAEQDGDETGLQLHDVCFLAHGARGWLRVVPRNCGRPREV